MATHRHITNSRKRQIPSTMAGLSAHPSSRGVTLGIYLFLAALSLAIFGQTVRYDFVNFDDDLYVYNTPAIKAGLTGKGITLAFVSQHARNWHPLTTISHML